MDELWGISKKRSQIIYPPCDTDDYIDKINLEGGLSGKFGS
jgi:hypothetical protein